MKKYEFTGNTKVVPQPTILDDYSITIREIRAIRDLATHGVRAGDVGGWIENEENLSHEGDCWVGKDAYVYDRSEVVGDALVVCSKISGGAHIGGNAYVQDSQILGKNSSIVDDAYVRGVIVHGTLHAHSNANFEDCVIFQYVKAMDEDIVVKTSNFYGENRLSKDTRIEKSNIHDVQFRQGTHRIIGSSIESASGTELIGDIELEDVRMDALDVTILTSEKIVLKHVHAVSLIDIDIRGNVVMNGVRLVKGTLLKLRGDIQFIGSFYPEANKDERYGIHVMSDNCTCKDVLIEGHARIKGSWIMRRSKISGLVTLESDAIDTSILSNSRIRDCVTISVPCYMNGVHLDNVVLEGDDCYKNKEELLSIGSEPVF